MSTTSSARAFYAQWGRACLSHSLATYEKFGAVASAILLALALLKLLPVPLEDASHWVARIGPALLAVLILQRAIMAPYWIYRERETRTQATETALRDEIAALRSQLDEREKRAQVRAQLGTLLQRARKLRLACEDESKEPPYVAIHQWEAEARTCLTDHVGPEYPARFESFAGLHFPPATTIASKDHYKMWQRVYIRESRLNEFLKELAL